MAVDILAIGAHPDDVEIGIGGLVRKLVLAGRRVGILDLTQGEMGTRGSVEERQQEAADSARILGVAERENACLPDGALANTSVMQRTVVPILRRFRARVILAPYDQDRHPDHSAAHALARDANYFAGLSRIESDAPPHRAPVVYYYRVYGEPTAPQFVVDISKEFETKLEALRAYRSQFFNPEYQGTPTYVSSEEFWESIRVKAAYWGKSIGATYGEPLYVQTPLGVQIPPGMEGNP
ncbi:MAG: bacillithiol biosynthesis deacetylase BshB1 [Candidatus Hydrogenedentes bacterium]|nr:bacillithiol biosynthesis deacetylase BshB1 [Candidatus Hydrogenedentota bacterium]